MNRKLLCLCGLPLLLLGLLAGCGPKAWELDALGGYTRVDRDSPTDAEPLIDSTDGWRVAGNASRTLFTPGFLRGEYGNGLRINANVAYQSYSRDLDGRLVGQPPATVNQGDVDLRLISPQIGPSFRLSSGLIGGGDEGGAFFLEPGITAGPIYGRMSADYTPVGGTRINESDNDLSWALRPYLRGGWVTSRFLVGIEVGWQRSGLDFDLDAGDDPEELYAGAFLGIRLSR